jgi:hypothetical protein
MQYLTRRDLLTSLGLGGLALVAGGFGVRRTAKGSEPAGRCATSPSRDPSVGNLPAPEAAHQKSGVETSAVPVPCSDLVERLLAPLVPGSRVGRLRLVSIHPVHAGAASVVLTHPLSLRHFQVDICRRGDAAGVVPVATTDQYELFVANGAQGRRGTPEALAHSIMALAVFIRANEAKASPLPVLTFAERFHDFGGTRLTVLHV